MSQNDDLQFIRGTDDWNVPEVAQGRRHFVLYNISTIGGRNPPLPAKGNYYNDYPKDWDDTKTYVRMPCSVHSKLNGKPRWGLIIDALKDPIKSTDDLVDRILRYNPSYKKKWKFSALHALLDEEISDNEREVFFNETLPAIAELALKLPEKVMEPVPLLRQGTNDWLSMSQEQIASLLANAFFCTFPSRNAYEGPYKTYPGINFSRLYAATGHDVLEKLKCIIHYFRTVTKIRNGKSLMPTGVLTFCRRSVDPTDFPRWRDCDALIGDVPIRANSHAAIERCDGLIQLDFANKYIGGGVLGHGSVQEEIRFSVCPELIITKLFTEVLDDNEALLIIGAQRYSTHVGYASSFEWVSPYRDDTQRDPFGRRRTMVLAIDALNFKNKAQQAKPWAVDRELNKAWTGFSFFASRNNQRVNYPGVATGNWGCGAFGGSPQLKSLLQFCAAAAARRPVLYITFEDEEFKVELNEMYEFLKQHHVTVGQLYNHIMDFIRRDRVDFRELFGYLKSVIPNRPSNDHRQRRSPTSIDPSTKETRQRTTDSTPTRRKSHSSSDPEMDTQDMLSSDIFLSSSIEELVTSNVKQKEINAQNSKQAELTSPDLKRKGSNSQDLKRDCNSPDLFTSEEMIIQQEELNSIKQIDSSDLESKIAETQQQNPTRKRTKPISVSDDEILGYCNKMAATEDKMAAAENKMSSQTTRLLDQFDKFDELNGNLNLKACHRKHFVLETKDKMEIDQEMPPEVKNKLYSDNNTDKIRTSTTESQRKNVMRKRAKLVSDSDDEMAGNSNKVEVKEIKMAASESSQTMPLLDQMDKFDESNGNLNLSVSHRKHFVAETKNKTEIDQVMPREVKNKLCKKITDYFSKACK